jgi:hypothetical protein
MVKRFALFAFLTLLLSMAVVPNAHASNHFSLQFGVTAGPGYVWYDGYYAPAPHGYRWVPGRWVSAPYGRTGWHDERWVREHRDEYWRRDRDRRERDRRRYWRRDERDWRR